MFFHEDYHGISEIYTDIHKRDICILRCSYAMFYGEKEYLMMAGSDLMITVIFLRRGSAPIKWLISLINVHLIIMGCINYFFGFS